jgi:hypothetical protein
MEKNWERFAKVIGDRLMIGVGPLYPTSSSFKNSKNHPPLSITCPDMTLKKHQQGFLVCNLAPVATASQLQPMTHPFNNNYLIHKPLVSTIWHVLQQMKKHCLWLHWFYKTYISPLRLWVCTLQKKKRNTIHNRVWLIACPLQLPAPETKLVGTFIEELLAMVNFGNPTQFITHEKDLSTCASCWVIEWFPRRLWSHVQKVTRLPPCDGEKWRETLPLELNI